MFKKLILSTAVIFFMLVLISCTPPNMPDISESIEMFEQCQVEAYLEKAKNALESMWFNLKED